MTYVCTTMPSPIGALKLVASDRGLAAICWESERPGRLRLAAATENTGHPVLRAAGRQLTDYFAGKLQAFSLPLDAAGTDFQKQVWAALQSIPFGKTRTYAEIAAQIGRPRAARAVGAANGRNPLAIVVPCHRVIGKDGTLIGFAGGLAAKTYLLGLESRGAEMESAA